MARLIDRVRARPALTAALVTLGGVAGAVAIAWRRGVASQPDIDALTRQRLGEPARRVEPSAADIHVAPAQYGR